MSRGLGRLQRFAFEHLRHVNGWCPMPDLTDAAAAHLNVPVTRSLAVALRRAVVTLSTRYGLRGLSYMVYRPPDAGGRRYRQLVRLVGTPDTLAAKSERWLYGTEFTAERVRWRTVTRTPASLPEPEA